MTRASLLWKAGVWPFVVAIAIQMVVATFGLYLVSALRAASTGESIWSNNQHEAVYFLTRALTSGDDLDWRRYEVAAASTLAAHKGRRAMQRGQIALAQAELVKAGNSPAEAARAVWLFYRFGKFGLLAKGLAHWTAADTLFVDVDALARAIEAETRRQRQDMAATNEWRLRIAALNDRIAVHAVAFSDTMAEVARVVEQAFVIINLGLAAILAALTIWAARRFLGQHQSIEGESSWQASHDPLTGLVNPARRSATETS